MLKHNAKNERIKRLYLTFLREAKQQSEPTLDAVAASLAKFETYTRFRDFKSFHHQQAVAFKRQLSQEKSLTTGKPLSKATQYSTLSNLKRFFQWLASQPGYKSSIQYQDAEYFNLSEKDSRVATARRQSPSPTLDQIKHAISHMPTSTDMERRDRALMAFILLTGARDSAAASFRLKHIDLEAGCVHQDAREVKTKFSKTFTTFFFPVGDEIREIVAGWISYLQQELLWGPDDPLFPKTKIEVGESRRFEAVGLERSHWSNATPIRKAFRQAFEAVDLPYFNPHSFRSTLSTLGERLCKTPEEFKGWSQNLGHEGVLTTFYSYGTVATSRQAEILRTLAQTAESGPEREIASTLEKLLRQIQDPTVKEALRGVQ
jgi:integrase